MATTIKPGRKTIDWTYITIMFMVILGLLIIFSVFVVGPIDYLLER